MCYLKAKVHYAILFASTLETCSLASLRLACVRDSIVIVSLRPKSTMLASQKTCSRP